MSPQKYLCHRSRPNVTTEPPRGRCTAWSEHPQNPSILWPSNLRLRQVPRLCASCETLLRAAQAENKNGPCARLGAKPDYCGNHTNTAVKNQAAGTPGQNRECPTQSQQGNPDTASPTAHRQARGLGRVDQAACGT